MPDLHAFAVVTVLMRVLEQMAITIIATDAMTALRLALLATELRLSAPR